MFFSDTIVDDKIKSNMTRRHHQSSSESASYSSATGPTHRRRTTPTQKIAAKEEDDDDADASDSQYNEESQEDEYESQEGEEPEQDIEDDDNVNGSESVSNNITPPNNNVVPETTPSISASEFLHPSSSSSSYVKIAPLPIFRGTPSESPVAHLSRFNKVCRANNASSMDMQMRIFPVTLEDEAALWYDLNVEPYYSSLSWEETKLMFLEAYYSVEPEEELRSELVGIRQGLSESVRSYFLRLQWILKRWPEHGMGEDLIRGVFVDGLREEFRDWVLMQKPNSLNDALRMAFEIEKVRRVRGKEGVGPTCEVRDGVGKDLIMGDDSSQGRVEMDEGGKGSEGLVGSVKKKQCHKCGKKKVLRNSSIESRVSHCD